MKRTPNDGSFTGLGLAIEERVKHSEKRFERICMLFCLGCAFLVGALLIV